MSLLKLNSIEIPVDSLIDFSQTYETIESSTIHRMGAAGLGRKQTLWTGKVRTVISASGWNPAGLSGVDFNSAVEIHCVAPRSKLGGVANINIGADSKRRSDGEYLPLAFGINGAGRTGTTVVVAANGDCSITPVAGATVYQVVYYPILTALFSSMPTESNDINSAQFSTELIAEEV